MAKSERLSSSQGTLKNDLNETKNDVLGFLAAIVMVRIQEVIYWYCLQVIGGAQSNLRKCVL